MTLQNYKYWLNAMREAAIQLQQHELRMNRIQTNKQIDAILLEDLDALLVHFGGWENHGTYYTDSNGAVCFSTDTASQEEIREALYTARQTCEDYAHDENGGIITENLIRSVRGSL
jgi:Tfp pilus assembly protein PilV